MSLLPIFIPVAHIGTFPPTQKSKLIVKWPELNQVDQTKKSNLSSEAKKSYRLTLLLPVVVVGWGVVGGP